jgi:hypothetical protein
MDDELLSLRRRIYEAGAAYDAHSLICNNVFDQGSAREVETVIAKYEATSLEYGVALLKLIEHIETLPLTDMLTDEIKKTRKVLDLLDREADIVARRLEILRRSRPQ